ncbi:MAG: NUDIX domain-containing protein [Armatimonadetes bacterium]|nr:NUDIX domain-containing protein [Armatimonadota bacterium]
MATARGYESAGGVVLHGGRVLLLHKRENDEIRLPKGHVDAGEDAARAALREVAEETGFADLVLEADLGQQAVTFVLRGEWVVRGERYWRMGLGSFRRLPRTVKDARRFRVFWCSVAEGLELLSFATEREFLRRAVEG